jgi:hypothetical protein
MSGKQRALALAVTLAVALPGPVPDSTEAGADAMKKCRKEAAAEHTADAMKKCKPPWKWWWPWP